MQNYIEVAPAPLISHQRYSSCPKLETIVEEASTEKFETVPKSPIMFLLPVLFTFLSYSLLCRHVVWGGKFSLHRRERKCIRLVIWECLLIGTFRFWNESVSKILECSKIHDKLSLSLSLSPNIYIYINVLGEIMNIVCTSMSVWEQSSKFMINSLSLSLSKKKKKNIYIYI